MGDITKFDDAEVIDMKKELCMKKVVINISEEDYDKITFKNVNSNAFRDTVYRLDTIEGRIFQAIKDGKVDDAEVIKLKEQDDSAETIKDDISCCSCKYYGNIEPCNVCEGYSQYL